MIIFITTNHHTLRANCKSNKLWPTYSIWILSRYLHTWWHREHGVFRYQNHGSSVPRY